MTDEKRKTATKKDASPDLVTVKLTKPHVHRGVLLPVGATLDLRPAQAEWLERLQIAKGIK